MSSQATTRTMSIYDVLAWLEVNKTSLIIGFVAVVVIGFGLAAYRWNAGEKELAASDALLKLKAVPGPNDTTVQPEPSAYLKVAEQFRGTSAAERALLLAGSAFFAEGKYTEAQAQFARFLRESPQSSFAATAAYGSAAALEAQGKQEEALAAYQNLAVRYPNSSVLDDAKLALARIHEARNQPELALRAYDELLKPGEMGMATSEAAARRRDLLAKHPQLAKTNSAAATASALVAPALTNAPVPAATNPVPLTP